MRVSEIFGPVFQGEGTLIGMPTIFVRLGGCDYRCSWCDTPYAVLPEFRHEWTKMEPADVLAHCHRLARTRPKPVITLSGGNPALQGDVETLLEMGHEIGWQFALETQGSVWPDWLRKVDHLILSPKPPSSGIVQDSFPKHAPLSPSQHVTCKIVIKDRTDFDWATDTFTNVGHEREIHLVAQVCNVYTEGTKATDSEISEMMLVKLDELEKWSLATGGIWNRVRVLPQLHVLAHGNARGK